MYDIRDHSCAVLLDGTTQCWGSNYYGQLGDGTTTNHSTPAALGVSSATDLALGDNDTCVRTSSGSVQCVGSNSSSALGYPTSYLTPTTTSLGVSGGATAIGGRVGSGEDVGTQCVVQASTGTVWCWGTGMTATPTQVPGITGATSVAVAGHICATTSAGALYCWGANGAGQLGNGTTTDSTTPVQVFASGVTDVAVAESVTCAVVSGAAKCWGRNYYGQIGDGTQVDRYTPTQVSGLTANATAVTVGSTHACAVVGGAAKCWGANGSGQLGNGSLTGSTTPVQVSGLGSGVADVGGGEQHTCALTSAGAVKCWGDSQFGNLGNGSTTYSKTPVAVSGLGSGVSKIGVAWTHACALLSTGAVKCWGQNDYGQLGNNTAGQTAWSAYPVSVSMPGTASAIAVSASTNCAIYTGKTSGMVTCWGNNGQGQAGNGIYGSYSSTAVTASYGQTNGALVNSQASVLVRKFAAAAGSSVSGHVTPIAYTMVNNTTGNQALMVTYDPLAAAAAMFIEQYQAHVNACNATTSESITEQQQQTGTYLWACSNANAKSAYLSGMQTLLNGARIYLFGRSDGSATAPCSGTSSPSYCIDTTQAHLPYTFVVPNYTSSAYNGDPTVTTGTGAYYYSQLDTALANYRSGIFGSTASGLHKSLQLAGIATFDTDTAAIVTTRVQRSGAYGTACVTQ